MPARLSRTEERFEPRLRPDVEDLRRELARLTNPHGYTTVRRRPVTQFARDVLAPAISRARRGQTACVEAPGADIGKRETARDSNRYLAGRDGVIPQMSSGVLAPAIRDAAGGHSTRVTVSGANHSKGVPPGNCGRCDAVTLKTVAKLAVAVIAPAIRRAGGGQAARVEATGTDNCELELT